MVEPLRSGGGPLVQGKGEAMTPLAPTPASELRALASSLAGDFEADLEHTSGPYRREYVIRPHFPYHIATQAFLLSYGAEGKFPLSAGTGSFSAF